MSLTLAVYQRSNRGYRFADKVEAMLAGVPANGDHFIRVDASNDAGTE